MAESRAAPDDHRADARSAGAAPARRARTPGSRPRSVGVVLAAMVLFQIASSLLLAPVAKEGFADTTLGYGWAFLSARPVGYDSWKPMSVAVKCWREHPEHPVYRRILRQQHSKLQYPPSSFFLTLGSEWLAPRLRLEPFDLLDRLGWLACWSTALLAVWIFRRALKLAGGIEPGGLPDAALVVALAVLFFPLTRGFWLGQVQSFITALAAGAVALWLAGRAAPAGALVGLAALLKPHYGLLLLFFALRRKWGAAAACASVAALGTGAAVAVFGWANHLDYLKALQMLARRGESYHGNFSVNGLLNRIAGLSDPLRNNADWSFKFPPYLPWVYWGTLASSVVLLLWVFLRRRPAKLPLAQASDFGVALLGVTMASPIAWEHHYAVLIPLLALAGGASTGEAPRRRRLLLPAVLAAWALSATYLQPAVRLADSRWNFLQSYLFFGAIAALGALASLAASGEERARDAGAR